MPSLVYHPPCRERESNTVAGWFAPQALSASEVLDAKECFEILGKGASTVEVRGRCIVPCPNRCLTLCAARARIAPWQSAQLGTMLRSLGYAPTEKEVLVVAEGRTVILHCLLLSFIGIPYIKKNCRMRQNDSNALV